MTEASTNLHDFAGFVDLQMNGCVGTDSADPALAHDQFVSAFLRILASGTAGVALL